MSDNKIDVSVIMPVYNVENYLEESLDSILSQSLKNIELLCINDGSTDNSTKILEEYQKMDNRIKIFNQKNKGAGAARNKGIKKARGKYVYFMDSDDILKPNALKELFDLSEEKNLDMVMFKLLNMDDENFETYKSDYYDMEYLSNLVKNKVFSHNDVINYTFSLSVSPPAKLYNRNLIEDVQFPEGLMFEDNVFFIKVFLKSNRIYFYDKYLYYRRVRDNSVSFADTSKLVDSITILNQMEDIVHEMNLFDKLNISLYSKKINLEHYRFTLVDPEYQQDFYDKMRKDFQIHKKEYESDPDFEKIEERLQTIFYKVLCYESCRDFQDSMSTNMRVNPKISVVVPVYNAENFLDESIPSLLNQTFKEIEVLCVNDGSKDNSLKILERFAKIDSRIKVIDKKNGGCGSARNMGLDYAVGEYIYFFDPDDYVLHNTFEELHNNATKNKSDLVMFKIARFIDGEPVDYSIPGFDFDNVFKGVDFNNFTFTYKDIKKYVLNASFAPWCKLYKKDLIESNGFRFATNVAFDDAPFHVQSLLKAKRISFIPDFFYHYRLSNPNSVNNTASNGIDIFKICDIVEDFLKENKFYGEFVKEFELFKVVQIDNYLFSTNTEEYFQKAKEEFGKIDTSNSIIYPHLIRRMQLICESESLNEYVQKFFNTQINKLENDKNNLKEQQNKLNEEIRNLEEQKDKSNKEIQKLKQNNQKLLNENKELKKENDELREIKDTVFNSNSWKITKPLRNTVQKIKK